MVRLGDRQPDVGKEPMPELEMAEQESAGGMDGVPDRQIAQQVLSRFDEKTQAIAVGVFVDGMEHEEVAQVLGISRRTVSRKLDRFVTNARKYLTRSEP